MERGWDENDQVGRRKRAGVEWSGLRWFHEWGSGLLSSYHSNLVEGIVLCCILLVSKSGFCTMLYVVREGRGVLSLKHPTCSIIPRAL